MKVYIDGLFYKGAGIGRYYETLIKGLVERGVVVYTCVPLKYRELFEKEFKDYKNLLKPIYVDYDKFSIKGLFKQGKILKELEWNVSLYHFPHVNLPLYVPRNTIVTVHDLRPFTRFWDKSLFKRKLFEWYLKRAVNLSVKIVTISMETRRHLNFLFKISSNRVANIYIGVSKKFFDYHFVKGRVNCKQYILYMGNRKKHKNLLGLIKAFDIIQRRISNIKLIIAGGKDKRVDEVDLIIEKFSLKESVIEYLSPKDEEVFELYKNAEVLILPSFFEGFGLTPLEAMAMGTPAIVSNIPVLKEIYNKSVVFFNPYKVEDIAEKICKVIVNNQLKRKIIQSGRKKVELFSEDRCIKNYMKLYEEIIGKHHENSSTGQVLSS